MRIQVQWFWFLIFTAYLLCCLLIICRHIIAFSAGFCNLMMEKQKKVSDKKISTFLSLPLLTLGCCCCCCCYHCCYFFCCFICRTTTVHQCTVFTEIFHISSLPTIGTLLLHSKHIVKCWIVNNTRAFAIFAFHHLFYKSWLCAEFTIFIFFSFLSFFVPYLPAFLLYHFVYTLLHWNPFHPYHSVSVCVFIFFFIDSAFPP